jgi:hypothetical protein
LDASSICALVDKFNAAWGDHDLDAAIALITDDCLFDAAARFTTEDAFVADDRFVQTWRYDFEGGHIRGVDVIEVRDGLVSAKLSYVKG